MDMLVGEPLAIDLINTQTVAGDLLASRETFGMWLTAEEGRLTAPAAPDLGRLRALRAHVESAVRQAWQGLPPSDEALQALNTAQAAAPVYRSLAWDGRAVTADVRRDGDENARFLAELAEAATELLTSASVTQIRACEGPHCRLIFLPAHPRRRWCSPALCGNRVRVARHYQRHKA
jgi:predicted RNA-binding Zn ribbon-like protein